MLPIFYTLCHVEASQYKEYIEVTAPSSPETNRSARDSSDVKPHRQQVTFRTMGYTLHSTAISLPKCFEKNFKTTVLSRWQTDSVGDFVGGEGTAGRPGQGLASPPCVCVMEWRSALSGCRSRGRGCRSGGELLVFGARAQAINLFMGESRPTVRDE